MRTSGMALHVASDEILSVPDDLEENKLFINVLLGVLSQLADRSTVCPYTLNSASHHLLI
jgi:hypothetical protein